MVNSKQQQILQHVARYGLSLRPVLDRLYFEGFENGSQNALADLRKQNLLKVTENAVANEWNPRVRYSYYTLTRKATALLGVSDNLGKERGPEVVAKDLAILWFCTMRISRSHKLESNEVAELLGTESSRGKTGDSATAKGVYCLSHKDHFRLFSTYVPRTTVGVMISELRKRISQARKVQILDMAMKSRQFGFLVLVETRELKEQLFEETRKLASEQKVKILVNHSPGPWKAM